MQDNQLHSNLTVEEAMNVAANLKLSQKVQRGEKLSVVSVYPIDLTCYLIFNLKVTSINAFN